MACGFDFPDPAKLSLDYHIDRPRIVAMSVDPPVFQPGTSTALEVLYLDVDTAAPEQIRWEMCGLRDDVWVVNFGLDCFGQSELVTLLGEQNPIFWSPPASSSDCLVETCGHYLPLLVTAEMDGEELYVSSMVEVYGSEVWTAEDLARPTLHERGVFLSHSRRADGRISLQAEVDSRFEDLEWRWYVDDGVLLKTGRTRTQGERDVTASLQGSYRDHQGRAWSDNIWEIPNSPGVYRAVVVVNGRLRSPYKEEDWEEEDWEEDEDVWRSTSNPDQVWAIIEVVQP